MRAQPRGQSQPDHDGCVEDKGEGEKKERSGGENKYRGSGPLVKVACF
jgi:hypothetical protein